MYVSPPMAADASPLPKASLKPSYVSTVKEHSSWPVSVPVSHTGHSAVPNSGLYVPTGHSAQSDGDKEPSFGLYMPGSHSLQKETSSTSEYLPAHVEARLVGPSG